MNHQTRVYDDVFEMLPTEQNPTPLVRLNRMNPSSDFVLYAKLEWMNPFGSVKDRAAWEMLRDLEKRGEVGNGRGIVEPTSGNTGISLAAMARARGYSMRAVVPNKVPLEKKVLLKIAGAELDVVSDELCPSPGMGDGTINLAKAHATATSCPTSTRTTTTSRPTSAPRGPRSGGRPRGGSRTCSCRWAPAAP